MPLAAGLEIDDAPGAGLTLPGAYDLALVGLCAADDGLDAVPELKLAA